MSRLIKGITYSYHRNIGWQDRTVRTVVGVLAAAGAIYFFETNRLASVLLSVFALAQAGTVLSARCIMCYFAGQCTIDRRERKSLTHRGVAYEGKSA